MGYHFRQETGESSNDEMEPATGLPGEELSRQNREGKKEGGGFEQVQRREEAGVTPRRTTVQCGMRWSLERKLGDTMVWPVF